MRWFFLGFIVGILVAPRPGPETRRVLSERLAQVADALIDMAALQQIEPERARTDGHAERASRRARAAEGSGAGAAS